MKCKKMSNRKRIKSNSKSTIFGITLKTKKYKIMRAPGTEVGEGAWSETSVQNAENERPGRKSANYDGKLLFLRLQQKAYLITYDKITETF